MQPILQLKNLTKAYTTHGRTTPAVNDISFTLRRGEILGILGVSGSGKSTLARLITRLEDADSGAIILDGQDITALRGAPLRAVYDKVQLVFQEHTASFNPRRTIGYGVSEALLNKGMRKAEAAERTAALLAECGLAPELAERYPSQLSGGQCQRAAIARALAHEPQLIILDEATSALDSAVQREIIGLLTRLQQEKGLAYLFICHNPALVRSFCHRVAVMHRGELVELGETEQVFTQPRSPWTRELLEAVLTATP